MYKCSFSDVYKIYGVEWRRGVKINMHVHACCIIKFKHHVYHTKTKSVYILWDEKKIV